MERNNVDYNLLTVVQLKGIAKERGVKGYSRMRKAELCILLEDPLPKSPPSILRKTHKKTNPNNIQDYPDYLKVYKIISREKYAQMANIELEKEKKELYKKKVTRKVTFA